MSKAYLGNGTSEFFLTTQSLILTEEDEENLKIIFSKDEGKTNSDLEKELSTATKKIDELKEELVELNEEIQELGAAKQEPMDAMDLMELLLVQCEHLTIKEIMTVTKDNIGIYSIIKAVKENDKEALIKIIKEL